MMLGRDIENSHIICSHIWPKHTYGKGLDMFNLKHNDINEPRNFLRLHRDIEHAFDKKWLCFDYEPISADEFKLKLRVVNPDLLDETKDVSIIKNNSRTKITTFGEINKETSDYIFTKEKKPFTRLLAAHANRTIHNARQFGWIPDESDYVSSLNRVIALARISLSGSTVLKSYFNDND